jgi:hypothetical protein
LVLSYLFFFLSININAETAITIAAITIAYSASRGKNSCEGVGSGDGVGEAEGVGVCEGVEVGVGVGPLLGVGMGVDVGVGVGVDVGVGVGDDDGYVAIVDHPLYPWTVHKARARTEYVLVLEPRLYSTVNVVVL